MKVILMRPIYLRRFSLAIAMAVLTASSSLDSKVDAAPVNIAPDGNIIMGLSDTTNGTGDQLNFNQGNLSELNDEIYFLPSPTGFDIGIGNGVDDYNVDLNGSMDSPELDFVGVLWSSPQNNVTSLSFQHYLANDGGWFGPGDQFLPGQPLAAGEIAAPEVQVTTNGGVSWTTITSTNDYVATLEGVSRGTAFANAATSPFVTFDFTAQNGINGIRVIGDPAGTVDPNGFTAYTEFKVFQDTGTVFPALHIDTESGEVTLSTGSGSGLGIRGYTIESTTGIGALDESQWDPISSGANQWSVLPGQDPTELLSEAAIASGASTVTLAANQDLSLGNIWRQNPFEDDIRAYVQLTDGRVRRIDVLYNGEDTNPVELGDLNFDGQIDHLDWPTVRDNFNSDFTSLSMLEAYGMGDVTFDGLVNTADLYAFKSIYDTANGAGSFQALIDGSTSVPEPATVLGGLSALLVSLGVRHRRLVKLRKR